MNPAIMVPMNHAAHAQDNYLRAFRKAGATQPRSAKTVEEVGCKPSRIVPVLVRRGLLVEVEPGHFYVDLSELEARAERARVAVLVGLTALGALLLVGFASYWILAA